MPHYYSKKQESPLNLIKFSAILRGNNLDFYSGSGVFCKDKVDKGTMLLVKSAIIEDNWKVLDLGCGYGPMGIAIAKAYPSAKILMSDVNKRAVMLAKRNIELNRLENARAIRSDLFEKIPEKFNTILLNPPQSAGKELCLKMIELSKEHLEKGGTFQMVCRHNIGGSVLEKTMLEVFGNVQELAKKSGYRIYISQLI
jgi:16S rRNA G1207 methylase RsmC